MARRRLPSPMYPPSGKRLSQSPESSGPRCVCTFVIRTSVSGSPQFTSPLMPHMSSLPPDLQLVDFSFNVKELNALHRAVDQARDTVKKSEAQYVLVKEEQERRPGQPEKMAPQPSASLRLRSPKGGLNVLLAPAAIEPDARLPIRVLVVLLDVTRQGLDIVMDERLNQLTRCSCYDDMLMDFHVGNAGILILKAAFEAPESLAEQRQLPEACCAMSQSPPKKIHLQGNEIAIRVRVLNRLLDLVREFGRQNLIGIEKQNPVVSEGQSIHCPLALLRPASRIMELDDLGAMRLSNGHGIIRTLRIDDIDFPDGLQRFQATPKVMRLIADGNNHGQREHRRGCPRTRYFSF